MNTQTTIAGVTFKNPVMTASGTFGSGMEYEEFVDLNRLGAVVTKGVANVPWPGNPTPRVSGASSLSFSPSRASSQASCAGRGSLSGQRRRFPLGCDAGLPELPAAGYN